MPPLRRLEAKLRGASAPDAGSGDGEVFGDDQQDEDWEVRCHRFSIIVKRRNRSHARIPERRESDAWSFIHEQSSTHFKLTDDKLADISAAHSSRPHIEARRGNADAVQLPLPPHCSQ